MPSKSPNRRRRRQQQVPSHSTPPCVFQRLMIVHNRLAELCIESGLDEGASLQELCENILYYHVDSSILGGNSTTSATNLRETNDAIQFAGICSALLSLPNSIVGNEALSDETKQVHLESSTLVFVPLEDRDSGIMAIAQVEQTKHATSSPLAVRKSIEKSHSLFCLLRGGISYHLSRKSKTTVVSSSGGPLENVIMNILQTKQDEQFTPLYPDLSELYSLRRQVRRQRRDLMRLTDDNEDQRQELVSSIASLDERIQSLADSLPISTLRTLLKTHFDEYIADAGLLAATTGIRHSCLVDLVPAPIPTTTTQDGMQEFPPPPLPTSTVLESLENDMHSLLTKTLQDCSTHDPRLVAISTFFNGRFVSTERAPSSNDTPLITTQTACSLMEFMSSYKAKLALHEKQHSGQQSNKARSPPKRLGSGLRRLISASLTDEDTIVTVDADESYIFHETDDPAVFLAPPPLSMLNVSDQVLQVELPSHGKVWTPKVFLPIDTAATDGSVLTGTLEANLVLLDIGEYSFLLFVRSGETSADEDDQNLSSPQQSVSLDSPDGQEEHSHKQETDMASSAIISIPTYSRLLERVASDLVNAVSAAHDFEQANTVECNDDNGDHPLAKSGQHVVFIDRATQRVVLYSDKDGMEDSKFSRSDALSAKVASGIDSRHILASNLPANAVAAFDDLMAQIHEREECSSGQAMQMCTYMREGWVYARVEGTKELYLFFNAHNFVTVSDMAKAADQVRLQLFKDSYR